MGSVALIGCASFMGCGDSESSPAAPDGGSPDSGLPRPPDGGSPDAHVSEEPAAVFLSPRAGWDETRRLLRATITDPSGLIAVTYAVNDAAPIALTVSGSPARIDIAEALALRPGDNQVTLTATSTKGKTHTETVSFHYGLTTTGGGAHSAAIVKGTVFVWGRHNNGQLGLGEPTGDDQSKTQPVPLRAFGASPVAALAFNQNHSIAIEADRTVWTWGANSGGQLGQGDAVARSTPLAVRGLSDAIYAVAGYGHTLVLRADGSVSAWGDNGAGQVGVRGDGTATDKQLTPVSVDGLPRDVVKIIGGSNHSAALTANGKVYVWGNNRFGNLGTGAKDEERHPAPVAVPDLADVIDIASGRDHVLALAADGTVRAWGLGGTGQLGYGENRNPDTEDRFAPGAVKKDAADLAGVVAVFANGNSSYAVLASGQYWGWGQNFSGQLAIGATSSEEVYALRAGLYAKPNGVPQFIDEITELRGLGVGVLHTIARTKDGSVYSWGWNTRGSLGIPTLANNWAQTQPLLVTFPP